MTLEELQKRMAGVEAVLESGMPMTVEFMMEAFSLALDTLKETRRALAAAIAVIDAAGLKRPAP